MQDGALFYEAPGGSVTTFFANQQKAFNTTLPTPHSHP
jgi:hypothetical protein